MCHIGEAHYYKVTKGKDNSDRTETFCHYQSIMKVLWYQNSVNVHQNRIKLNALS